jgi:putative transposase
VHAHPVFVTKYRRGAFTDEILTRCEEIMRKVCTGFGTELREFNGDTDHVHLHVHYPPSVALSRLVNSPEGVAEFVHRGGHRVHAAAADRLDPAVQVRGAEV